MANILEFRRPAAAEAQETTAKENAMQAIESHYAAIQKKRELAQDREITIEAFAARQAYQQRLQEPTPNADGVRIGDIYYHSWGYDMTIVDFWQVIALKGKKTAIVQEIKCEHVGGASWDGYIRPCRDEFISDKQYTVRTRTGYDNRPSVNVPDHKGHSMSQTTDDKLHYYNTMD